MRKDGKRFYREVKPLRTSELFGWIFRTSRRDEGVSCGSVEVASRLSAEYHAREFVAR